MSEIFTHGILGVWKESGMDVFQREIAQTGHITLAEDIDPQSARLKAAVIDT